MCAAGEKAILNGGFFERHHPYGSHPRPRRDALAAFERPAEGYRGWIVPAGLVNPQMKLRMELSRSLLNLAERDGRASYSQFTARRGYRHSGSPREDRS